jgi:hypothetical protein
MKNLRCRRWGHVALLVAAGIVQPARAADDWDDAAHWVGKYPADALPAHAGGLLGLKGIRVALDAILPRPERALLARFAVEMPVQQSAHYLLLRKCMPHNCPADRAVVVVDLQSHQVWAVFFSRTGQRVATRWYGADDDGRNLPEGIRQAILAELNG